MSSAKERSERKRVSARKFVDTHEGGFKTTSLVYPEGVKLFLPKKAGIYKLNVIVYKAGIGNPNADAGEWYYERTYWAHAFVVGPNRDTYVCPAKTFNLPCPICEQRMKLERDADADEDYVKALAPKERQLWNVEDLEEPGIVKLWDISYHLFGKNFRNKIKNAEDGEYDYCTDPEEGFTLRVGATEKTMGKGKPFLEFADIEFKPRKPLEDSLLKQAHCLDQIPKRVSYDELRAAFLAEPKQEEDEDQVYAQKVAAREERERERPSPRPEPRPEPIAEAPKSSVTSDNWEMGMMVNHTKHGECEIVKLLDGGNILRLEDAALKYHEVPHTEVTLAKTPKYQQNKDLQGGDDELPPRGR